MSSLDNSMISIAGIQKWCLHDGPGIRTTIFIKGCPMRCPWCYNPETFRTEQDLNYIQKRCIGTKECGKCLSACKEQAIYPLADKVNINRDACIICGECAKSCPSKALFITGEKISVAALLKNLFPEEEETENKNITLSGGEPLIHPLTVLPLVLELKRRKCHIAVETCGFFDMTDSHLLTILESIDLLFFDIKHPFSQPHKQAVGIDNLRILWNLQNIAKAFPHLPIITRTLVLSDFSDSVQIMEAIRDIILGVPTVIKHELLQYQSFGEDKYQQLGLNMMNSFRKPVPESRLKELKSVFQNANIKVSII